MPRVRYSELAIRPRSWLVGSVTTGRPRAKASEEVREPSNGKGCSWTSDTARSCEEGGQDEAIARDAHTHTGTRSHAPPTPTPPPTPPPHLHVPVSHRRPRGEVHPLQRLPCAPRSERTLDPRLKLVSPPLPATLREQYMTVGISEQHVNDNVIEKRVKFEQTLSTHVTGGGV